MGEGRRAGSAIPPDVSADPPIAEEALGEAGPGKSIVHRHGPINWILVSRGDEQALRASPGNTLQAQQWPAGPIVLVWLNDRLADRQPAYSQELTEVRWPIWLRKWISY